MWIAFFQCSYTHKKKNMFMDCVDHDPFNNAIVKWIIIAMFAIYPPLSMLEPLKSVFSFPSIWYYWSIWKWKHPLNAGEARCWWKRFHWTCTDKLTPSAINMFGGYLSQAKTCPLWNHYIMYIRIISVCASANWFSLIPHVHGQMFDTFHIRVHWFWAT